jgi:hypothetical protein
MTFKVMRISGTGIDDGKKVSGMVLYFKVVKTPIVYILPQ